MQISYLTVMSARIFLTEVTYSGLGLIVPLGTLTIYAILNQFVFEMAFIKAKIES